MGQSEAGRLIALFFFSREMEGRRRPLLARIKQLGIARPPVGSSRNASGRMVADEQPIASAEVQIASLTMPSAMVGLELPWVGIEWTVSEV